MDKSEVKDFLKDHFFDIFDQAGNGIIITDPKQEDNPIIYVNKAFSDIFEYSYEESIGKNCRFLQARDIEQKNIKLVRQAIKNQKQIHTILRNYTKSGKLVYNEVKISPIFDEDTKKIKFFLSIHKDISNQFELQEKLKKEHESNLEQEKFILKQSKLASMGEMIDAIAHQWLNPLTLIKLFSQESERLLKEDKKPLKKERILSHHEKLIVQIDHLVSTLNEFRSFYRPDEDSQCISAKTMIESTLLLIKDDLLKHKIQTTVDVKEDFEIKVVKNQFKHVILNLFSNSRDAFEEKNVEQKTINVLITEDETHHIIKVSDNAGGIPSNVIGKIFEPNFTTKSSGKGSGVGLYLCKQILDKFHIIIEVSNENDGACFTIKYQKDLHKIC